MSIYGVNDAMDVHAPHVQRCVEWSRVVIYACCHMCAGLEHCSIAPLPKTKRVASVY